MDISTLIANLALDDETDRIYAADDLGEANAAEAILPLMERLAIEPSRKVRESIFLALGKIDSPAVPIVVAALLESDNAFLRNQSVGLLQRKGAAAAPALLARMHDADPDVRKFVLDTAAGIASPAVEPVFDAAIRDQDVNVVIAALEYLGEHRMNRFKPDVEEAFLKGTQPMLVCAAFAALLQIGDATSWQCIRQRYPSPASVPSWELGWWLRALGDFGAMDEIEVFHDILLSHDGNVARDTIDALECFQIRHGRVAISEAFWKTLRELLCDTLPSEDKLQLLRVVGGFGAPAGIADHLLALLDHSDRLTRLGAIEGIKRLGRPDLLARLVSRGGRETDAEVASALAECGGAS
jgi:HEAT repeat protein